MRKRSGQEAHSRRGRFMGGGGELSDTQRACQKSVQWKVSQKSLDLEVRRSLVASARAVSGK